jgi:hypothetical protein
MTKSTIDLLEEKLVKYLKSMSLTRYDQSQIRKDLRDIAGIQATEMLLASLADERRSSLMKNMTNNQNKRVLEEEFSADLRRAAFEKAYERVVNKYISLFWLT